MSTAVTTACSHLIGVGTLLSTRDGSMGSTQAARFSGPTAATTSGGGAAGRSLPSLPVSTAEEKPFFLTGSFPFLGASASDPTAISTWPQAWVPPVRARTRSPCSTTAELCDTLRLVDDPELSPLDLVLAPNGNIVVSSEWPFGTRHATCSVREYNHSTGALARVFAPDPAVGFMRPRGLRFGPDGHLYCVGQDHVIAFDFATGTYLGVVLRLPRLNGQALVLWDRQTSS